MVIDQHNAISTRGDNFNVKKKLSRPEVFLGLVLGQMHSPSESTKKNREENREQNSEQNREQFFDFFFHDKISPKL